jgi:drug/metabolite transporter (DMT)-like permease
MNNSAQQRSSILLMILTAILSSSSGLVIKVMHFQALSILSARSAIAAIVFSIYLVSIRQFKLKWTPLQVVAAVGNIGTQLTFIMATKLTTAANAIFLEYTAPVYIVIFAYLFLKERPQRADWIAMVVIFAGMFLFFGDRLSLNGLYGNLLAIFSGVLICAPKRMACQHNHFCLGTSSVLRLDSPPFCAKHGLCRTLA